MRALGEVLAQLLDVHPAPFTDLALVGRRLALEFPGEHVIHFMLDQLVRELRSVRELERAREEALDAHFLEQAPLRGLERRFTRPRMPATRVRPPAPPIALVR